MRCGLISLNWFRLVCWQRLIQGQSLIQGLSLFEATFQPSSSSFICSLSQFSKTKHKMLQRRGTSYEYGRHGIVEESSTSNPSHFMNTWSFPLKADMLKQDGMLHYWEGWLLKMEKKAEALKPRLTLQLYYQCNMVTGLDVVVKT